MHENLRRDVTQRLNDLACQAVHVAGGGDRAVRWLAERQHGVVTADQARACGLGRSAIAGRRARGQWRTLQPGVLLVTGAQLSEHARILAAVLSCSQYAVARHATAAWLWGMSTRPPDAEVVASLAAVLALALGGLPPGPPRL